MMHSAWDMCERRAQLTNHHPEDNTNTTTNKQQGTQTTPKTTLQEDYDEHGEFHTYISPRIPLKKILFYGYFVWLKCPCDEDNHQTEITQTSSKYHKQQP